MLFPSITVTKLILLTIITTTTTTFTAVFANNDCPTPDLSKLFEWTDDLRAAAQNAGLEAASTECPINFSRKKVLMIGVDGLRVDAAAMLPLPNFRRLEKIGQFSYWANVQKTAGAVSGPGWASMFTGVEPEFHDVSSNGDLSDLDVTNHPTVFNLVKDTFNKKIGASVSWHPLVESFINVEDPTTLDEAYLANNDSDMAQKAVDWIVDGTLDFIFVDFDACDAAGHSNGFDGYLSTYQDAVIQTDTYIGNLLDAVESRSSGEEWLIVLTSDHGGKFTSHGPNNNENRRIPLIVASNSPRVKIGRAPHDDPGSHKDVLPTIMHFLGGDPSTIPSDVQGQVFGFKDYVRVVPPPVVAPPTSSGCGSLTDGLKQSDYRGTTSQTISGKTCQAWDDQEPHSHSRTSSNYPDAGLESNYCRNPDGEDGAWCYTTDPNERWQLCDVPTCSDLCGTLSIKQVDYVGSVAVTESGRTCQEWDVQAPHSHSRTASNYPDSRLESNYCRNPDGEDRAWCYTTDPNQRWEHCAVPDC